MKTPIPIPLVCPGRLPHELLPPLHPDRAIQHLADELGIRFYDAELILEILKEIKE